MIGCDAIRTWFGDETDPRLNHRYIRCIDADGSSGTVVLIGVVHDHPASEYRTRRLVEWLDPDLLVLELPPLSVPLFQLYADDLESPPQLGGEMSAAIQGTHAPVVGIDAPNLDYLNRLVRRWISGGMTARLFLATIRDFVRSFGHAASTRVGATVGAATGTRPMLYDPIRYEDCSSFDTPEHQARHEADHLTTRSSFVNAIELPQSITAIDELREETMVHRIDELRTIGDLVVILGMEHLDTVADGLESPITR